LRIKEQETHLTLQEHDDDDELISQSETNNYLANEHQLILQPIKFAQLFSHWASNSYLPNAHHLII